MRPALFVCLLVVFLAGLTAPADADPPPEGIVFGMTPVIGVQATLDRFKPLSEHLARQLGLSVRLVVADTYGDLIDRMAAGEVDLAKISPLAYVRARRRIHDLRLIATHVAFGSVTYSSYLVAIHDRPLGTLEGWKGARVCFADPDSTSGYLYPAAFLRTQGIDPQKDLAVTFGGNHRACLEGLYAGRFELAATWAGAIRDARQSGLDVAELSIVAKTGRIPYDAYCVRPGLDDQLANRIQEALLGTNTLSKEGRRVLSPTLGINGWVRGDNRVYDGIREVETQVPERALPRGDAAHR